MTKAPDAGVAFDASDVQARAQVAVIDDNTRAKLFPHGENPLGQVILLGSVPVALIYSFFVEYYVSSMTGAVKE